MKMILQYLGTVAAILITVHIVPGITDSGWEATLLAALIWSVITFVI